MPWLVLDGKVLATLEVADRGLSAQRGCSAGTASRARSCCRPARSVHTVRMRFPIDVAFLDADHVVLRMVTMRRTGCAVRCGGPAR